MYIMLGMFRVEASASCWECFGCCELYFLEIANKFYISEEVALDPRYRSSTVKLFLWETSMFNQGIKPYTLGMIT